eukprot:jgi/Picre1/32874/NNA_008203.t1
MYFPTFYAIKAKVSGQPLSYAVQKYKSEIWESVKTLWSVWVPLQLINFAFVPRHMRVPYVAGVSFGWTMILSVMQGKFDDAKAKKDAELASKMSADAADKVNSILQNGNTVTAAQSKEQ